MLIGKHGYKNNMVSTSIVQRLYGYYTWLKIVKSLGPWAPVHKSDHSAEAIMTHIL